MKTEILGPQTLNQGKYASDFHIIAFFMVAIGNDFNRLSLQNIEQSFFCVCKSVESGLKNKKPDRPPVL